MSFTGVQNITATNDDYSHSGYDKGHLVSAEDFANNLESERITFRYYNCLPQTPNLNRGVWKKKETSIRTESRSDSLFIICGGYDFKLVNKLYVPSYCFKIVKNTRNNKITHVLIFTNNKIGNTANETNLNILMEKSGYKKLEDILEYSKDR
jgi:endonuclease G